MSRCGCLILLALGGAALFLGGCSESASPTAPQTPVLSSSPARSAPNSAYKILESFEVGKGVYVRALAVDLPRRHLWVGTSVGALQVDLASRQVLQTVTRDNGLANEYVFALWVDRLGDVWFGTNGGGVSRLHDGQWRTFFPMHGLADYWVYAFNERSDGSLWIGTWAGLNRYDRGTERFQTYLKELVNEWVYGLAVDTQDRVWIGTEGGVNMFDGRVWSAWTHADGLGAPNKKNLPFSPNTGLGTRSRHDLSVLVQGAPTYNPNYVFDVLAARDGSIWAGTWGGGAARYAEGRWRNYTTDDGLAGDIVYAIEQDAEGALWFGTSGGVSRYDGTTWVSYGKAAGLFDAHVYALAAPPEGGVWVGTREGVVYFGRDNRSP